MLPIFWLVSFAALLFPSFYGYHFKQTKLFCCHKKCQYFLISTCLMKFYHTLKSFGHTCLVAQCYRWYFYCIFYFHSCKKLQQINYKLAFYNNTKTIPGGARYHDYSLAFKVPLGSEKNRNSQCIIASFKWSKVNV